MFSAHVHTHTAYFERYTFFFLILIVVVVSHSKLKSSIYYHWHPTGQSVCNVCLCAFLLIQLTGTHSLTLGQVGIKIYSWFFFSSFHHVCNSAYFSVDLETMWPHTTEYSHSQWSDARWHCWFFFFCRLTTNGGGIIADIYLIATHHISSTFDRENTVDIDR